MRTIRNVLLVAVLTGFAAQFLGWVAVPMIALIVTIGNRELSLHAWHVGAGAALAWGVMLGRSALSPAFSSLLDSLAHVFRIPGAGLVFIALLLPFALGWSMSAVTTAVVRRRG